MNEFEALKVFYPSAFTVGYEEESAALKKCISNQSYGYVALRKNIENVNSKEDLFWYLMSLKYQLEEFRYRYIHQSYKALYASEEIEEIAQFLSKFENINDVKFYSLVKNNLIFIPVEFGCKNIQRYNSNWTLISHNLSKLEFLNHLLWMIFKFTDDDFVIIPSFDIKFKSYLTKNSWMLNLISDTDIIEMNVDMEEIAESDLLNESKT